MAYLRGLVIGLACASSTYPVASQEDKGKEIQEMSERTTKVVQAIKGP